MQLDRKSSEPASSQHDLFQHFTDPCMYLLANTRATDNTMTNKSDPVSKITCEDQQDWSFEHEYLVGGRMEKPQEWEEKVEKR